MSGNGDGTPAPKAPSTRELARNWVNISRALQIERTTKGASERWELPPTELLKDSLAFLNEEKRNQILAGHRAALIAMTGSAVREKWFADFKIIAASCEVALIKQMQFEKDKGILQPLTTFSSPPDAKFPNGKTVREYEAAVAYLPVHAREAGELAMHRAYVDNHDATHSVRIKALCAAFAYAARDALLDPSVAATRPFVNAKTGMEAGFCMCVTFDSLCTGVDLKLRRFYLEDDSRSKEGWSVVLDNAKCGAKYWRDEIGAAHAVDYQVAPKPWMDGLKVVGKPPKEHVRSVLRAFAETAERKDPTVTKHAVKVFAAAMVITVYKWEDPMGKASAVKFASEAVDAVWQKAELVRNAGVKLPGSAETPMALLLEVIKKYPQLKVRVQEIVSNPTLNETAKMLAIKQVIREKGKPAPGAGASSAAGASAGAGAPAAESPPRVRRCGKKRYEFQHSEALDEYELEETTDWDPLTPSEWLDDPGVREDPITKMSLGDDGEMVVKLPCSTEACPCVFNVSTLVKWFATSHKCPACSHPYTIPGPQPTGSMQISKDQRSCNGYEECGTIFIRYDFPEGTQSARHTTPGRPYPRTHRTAYLPDNDIGLRCLWMLKCAFVQGKLFRIGESRTTGREGIVWGIHQKSSYTGGTEEHGWPDPTYIQRLETECRLANVSFDE